MPFMIMNGIRIITRNIKDLPAIRRFPSSLNTTKYRALRVCTGRT
jgi:hypothetical protein